MELLDETGIFGDASPIVGISMEPPLESIHKNDNRLFQVKFLNLLRIASIHS